jgi:hypothetical protein
MNNIEKCPTCGAPAKMTWSGLDLVAESGDETLASKHYEYQPNGNNTVLVPSGPQEFKDTVSEALEETRKDFCIWYYAQSQPLDANKVFEWFHARKN